MTLLLDDDSEEDPRQRAFQAAADVWIRAGRPGLPMAEDVYADLQIRLQEYLNWRYKGGLTSADVVAVVDECLLGLLPRLFTRSSLPNEPNPEDLLQAVSDRGLDVWSARREERSLESATEGLPAVHLIAEDSTFVSSIFGHGTVAYLSALRQAASESQWNEFAVATQYMNLHASSDAAPSWQSVADRMTQEKLTASDVERLMFRFTNRLGGRHQK